MGLGKRAQEMKKGGKKIRETRKGWRYSLKKPQEKNPKRVKQGEASANLENLESSKVEESTNFEVLKLFLQQKVPLKRILNLCPIFKAKVLSKGV